VYSSTHFISFVSFLNNCVVKNVFFKLNKAVTARTENIDEIRDDLTERNRKEGRNRCSVGAWLVMVVPLRFFIWHINLKWLRCE
jgi:hypothetical protein